MHTVTLFWKTPGEAAVPEGTRVYAIGDIHGRSDLVAQLLARIDRDLDRYPIDNPIEVYLGDYVDRGPDSRGVLNMLVANGRSRNAVFLKGNHEALLLGFLQDPLTLGEWRRLGGLATLLSYGLTPSFNPTREEMNELAAAFRAALPPAHLAWLPALKSHLVIGDFFFVHAGARPGIPLEMQRPEDLFWIRDEFLSSTSDFGKIIVHGHTPVLEPEVHPNRINIDTGAFATGRLTCLVLEKRTLRWLA